jgi:N-methylhydantoinase B
VSVEGARRYGVVIENGTVNDTETQSLRTTLKEERGEVSLFDRGGTIEEIKAKAKEETGLSAPVSPSFNVARQ